MKKKVIVTMLIVLLIILLCPIPMRLKDGGTVKYQAILYSVSDVHRVAPSTESGYEEGYVIEILGMQIFNNVKRSSEKQWAIPPHFYLDGKGYFYNGATYELPEGFEYIGDVINVGNTFSDYRNDFEGNVDGKIYMNESVADIAYFSWAEWNEEVDGGPAPFLKLEVKVNN